MRTATADTPLDPTATAARIARMPLRTGTILILGGLVAALVVTQFHPAIGLA